MVKLTLQGKYNYATVFTENIEESAIGQVIGMLNEPITKNTTVAIMPDVHAGKGSTIGTTKIGKFAQTSQGLTWAVLIKILKY